MSLTEAREVSPVQFFGGNRGIAYAKGEGFQKIAEPTAEELAALEMELREPPATAPTDAAAGPTEPPPDPTDPQPTPSPDDPESKAAPVGKAQRTPAKN